MEEKELYQLDFRVEDRAVPIDWSKLPEGLLSKVPSPYIRNVISFSSTSGLNIKTVIYFRKVKKFKKSITQFEVGDVIFGV